jgi:hypothetical protein
MAISVLRRKGIPMPYRKPKPQAQCRCRVCRHPLYSRTEIPAETSALCTECAIANPGEAGVVFKRAATRVTA